MPGGARGVGGVAGLIIVIVGAVFFHQDLSGLLGLGGSGGANSQPQSQGQAIDPANDPQAEQVDFMSFLIDDQQKVWADIFRAEGKRYRPAKLVLYTRGTDTGCGYGKSAIGPFYCPPDQKVYLDLDFFQVMRQRLGAPGDFAQAYVLAHEIGHHVQNLLGTNKSVDAQTARAPSRKNELSVRLELQADCYAGIWAHSTRERKLLEKGDVDESLKAAWQIGDDTLQKSAGRKVSPDSFTHGSSEQRTRWFRRGLDSGRLDACDTFSANPL